MDIIGTDDNNTVREDEKLMELARTRFKMSSEGFRQIYADYVEDNQFLAGEQWDQGIKAARQSQNRPCLTVNRLPQSVRIITNDLRENRPGMLVSPTDDDTADTADVLQGLIRHIEDDSNAEVAYDTGAICAVKGGIGFLRVITEYSDSMSFDQDIKIKRIRNPLTVFPDPRCQEPDYSDAEFYFITDDMLYDEYQEMYPTSDAAIGDGFDTLKTTAPDWYTDDVIRVAEYFYIERERKKIVQISMGDDKFVVFEDVLEKYKSGPRKGDFKLMKGQHVTGRRETWIKKVKWAKINGIEVLESTEWPIDIIPIIPVLGDEIDINGKITLESAIRHAKDPQRLYNIWNSAEAEMIGLAPRAPWVAPAGAFEGFEDKWDTANTRSYSYLEYNPTDVDGRPLPPPMRNVYEPATQAIGQAKAASGEDIKVTMGIPDAGLGMPGNETSGLAIAKRQTQSQLGFSHFADNQKRAMKLLGRIVLALIPVTYDTKRTLRIISESGVTSTVKVNQPLTDQNGQQIKDANGAAMIHDLTTMKYGVTVASGPSYQTKRQEAANTTQDLIQSFPAIMPVAGDILVRSLDIPYASEIADRLRPADPNTDVATLQGQVQQQQQLIQALTAHLNESNTKLEAKVYDIQSDERKNQNDNLTKLATTAMMVGSQEAKHLLSEELGHIQHDKDMQSQQTISAAETAADLQKASMAAAQPPAPGGSQ